MGLCFSTAPQSGKQNIFNSNVKDFHTGVSVVCTDFFPICMGGGVYTSDTERVENPVTILAIRSNLLLPALNVGAELPVGNRSSFAVDHYYPWAWPDKSNKDCFELLGWSAEYRFWFGKEREPSRRLLGHSVALYGSGGYYDFEKDYTGIQGEFFGGGVDYTYAIALGKKGRVNMEFTLAVGYIHANSRKYKVLSDYGPLFKEDGDILFDYFGPTKAAISIVVPIRKKGGRK